MSAERVRHFRILEKIGEGGMGEVFSAFDEVLERRVALKAIHRSHGLSELARERFQREARTLSALDHPGICRIHDFLQTAEGDYLVLELVEGRPLHEVMTRRVPRARALELAEQLAAVLAAAHKAGVIHRDLKPGNVMVTPAARIKVLDFGLASREGGVRRSGRKEAGAEPPLGAAGAEGAVAVVPEVPQEGLVLEAPPPEPHPALRTRPGTVMGTLHYMSPEQARGEPVTAATDLFALGLILQELFTGHAGHPRGIGLTELHTRVMAGSVDLSPDLGHDIGALVRALTSPEPEARPRAEQVFERLRWIRARPRRIVRRSLAAALLLAGTLAWGKYTIDLRRRERQAEALIEYMLVDLRERLVPLGRLEILVDVGRRALEYFDAVPRRQWTDEELTRRCQAYHQLGDALSQQGDRAGAMEFFRPALTLADELVRRDPTHQDWVFQRGQLQFYVGQVPYELGDYEAARPYFVSYLDTARALLALDPGRPAYRIELAYARTNLGALALEQGHWDEATLSFEEVVALWRELVRDAPEDPEREYELADALSWLAEGLEKHGQLARAIAVLREEYTLREKLRELDPQNATWEYLRSVCRQQLAAVLDQAGEVAEALPEFMEAVTLARELVRRDPSNAEWRRHLGVALTTQARALLRGDLAEEAEPASSEARAVLEGLSRIDPTNHEWLTLAATAQLIESEVWHALGAPEEALEGSELVLERLEGDGFPELMAETHVLRGRALIDLGEPESARLELEQALAVLERVAPEQRATAQEELRAQALAYLGRHAEATEQLDRLEASGRRLTFLRELLQRLVATRR